MIRSWILLGYLQLPSGWIDFNKEDYIGAKIGSKMAFSTQPIHLSSPFSPASQSRPRCRELLAKMCWPRCRAAWPNFSMAWPNELKVITVIHGNMDDKSTSFENHPSEIEEPHSLRKPAPKNNSTVVPTCHNQNLNQLVMHQECWKPSLCLRITNSIMIYK